MTTETYLTADCPLCGNGIEFPEHGLGEWIRCPHCGEEIPLEVPISNSSDHEAFNGDSEKTSQLLVAKPDETSAPKIRSGRLLLASVLIFLNIALIGTIAVLYRNHLTMLEQQALEEKKREAEQAEIQRDNDRKLREAEAQQRKAEAAYRAAQEEAKLAEMQKANAIAEARALQAYSEADRAAADASPDIS